MTRRNVVLTTADDVPQFEDEADFDNYMNDEEYDLMSTMFPEAVKQLQDYTHWDNLSVKLAIFDSDFDLDAAMVEIKSMCGSGYPSLY